MKKMLLTLILVMFVSACYSEEDDSGNVMQNPNFQRACIGAGGTVYPTRYGYGGCMIDGFSYSQVNGVRLLE